jgi:ribose 5-phosphate isomerase A
MYDIEATLRMNNDQPYVTDHGHYILDCHFQEIEHAEALTYDLNAIPGVAENGLFINMADLAVIGYPDGRTETLHS